MNKIVYKTASLTGERERLLSRTQITLGKKKYIVVFLIWINYDFHHILLHLLGLWHIISDSIIDDIASFYTGGVWLLHWHCYFLYQFCMLSWK